MLIISAHGEGVAKRMEWCVHNSDRENPKLGLNVEK